MPGPGGPPAGSRTEDGPRTATGPCPLTGGSGFLGINLIRLLLSRGVSVRSLDIAAFDYPERGRVDAILGDIRAGRSVLDSKQLRHRACVDPNAGGAGSSRPDVQDTGPSDLSTGSPA